jgi:hypothetical protein
MIHAEVRGPIPEGVKVGDHLHLQGTLIVRSIETPGLDVVRLGDALPRIVAGEDEADVLVVVEILEKP